MRIFNFNLETGEYLGESEAEKTRLNQENTYCQRARQQKRHGPKARGKSRYLWTGWAGN